MEGGVDQFPKYGSLPCIYHAFQFKISEKIYLTFQRISLFLLILRMLWWVFLSTKVMIDSHVPLGSRTCFWLWYFITPPYSSNPSKNFTQPNLLWAPNFSKSNIISIGLHYDVRSGSWTRDICILSQITVAGPTSQLQQHEAHVGYRLQSDANPSEEETPSEVTEGKSHFHHI